MSEQLLSVQTAEGVVVVTFITHGRSPSLPSGASWLDSAEGYWHRPATDANIAAELARSMPGSPPWRRITRADLPTDREFRNAWSDDGRAIGHDMSKARGLHLERLRADRVPRLEALDREWSRATGQKRTAEATRIEAERQALRDMPTRVQPALDAAQTIGDLRTVV